MPNYRPKNIFSYKSFKNDPIKPTNDPQIVNNLDHSLSAYVSSHNINNDAKQINSTLYASAIRTDKFDIFSGLYDTGYPKTFQYNLCDQKLSTIYSLGPARHVSLDNNHSITIIENNNNNPFLCSVATPTPCVQTPCPSGQVFDPTTCLCVPLAVCIPQSGCEPSTIYQNFKPKIYGYAFYLDRVREINIPDIGTVKSSCGGGHGCNGTLFRPTLVFTDSSRLQANRNISMNNAGGRYAVGRDDGIQIPVPGFQPETYYERSDTFEFVLDDPSLLTGARLNLNCQYSGCHTGVTFVVLVGETVDTNEKIVLFSSCIAPGEVNSKPIGTIDCDNDPVPCETQPLPSMTPTPSSTPSISVTPTKTPTLTPTATPTPTPSVSLGCIDCTFWPLTCSCDDPALSALYPLWFKSQIEALNGIVVNGCDGCTVDDAVQGVCCGNECVPPGNSCETACKVCYSTTIDDCDNTIIEYRRIPSEISELTCINDYAGLVMYTSQDLPIGAVSGCNGAPGNSAGAFNPCNNT